MTALAGPFYAFALLLITAGGLKVVDPRPTGGALRATGVPASPAAVRVLGVGEIVIGAGALAIGNRTFAIALSASYVAFAVFVASVRARDLPLATCGCFGKEDTPPTVAHIVLTMVAAAVGAVISLNPIGPLNAVLGDQPWAGVPLILAVLTATYLMYVALTTLARTMSIVSGGSTLPGGTRT